MEQTVHLVLSCEDCDCDVALDVPGVVEQTPEEMVITFAPVDRHTRHGRTVAVIYEIAPCRTPHVCSSGAALDQSASERAHG